MLAKRPVARYSMDQAKTPESPRHPAHPYAQAFSTLRRPYSTQQEHRLAEALDQRLMPAPNPTAAASRVSQGRLHRRQGDEIHAHLLGQRQLFSVMARRRQPALMPVAVGQPLRICAVAPR